MIQPLMQSVYDLLSSMDSMRTAMRDGTGAPTEQFTQLLDTIDVDAAMRELDAALAHQPAPRAKILPFRLDRPET